MAFVISRRKRWIEATAMTLVLTVGTPTLGETRDPLETFVDPGTLHGTVPGAGNVDVGAASALTPTTIAAGTLPEPSPPSLPHLVVPREVESTPPTAMGSETPVIVNLSPSSEAEALPEVAASNVPNDSLNPALDPSGVTPAAPGSLVANSIAPARTTGSPSGTNGASGGLAIAPLAPTQPSADGPTATAASDAPDSGVPPTSIDAGSVEVAPQIVAPVPPANNTAPDGEAAPQIETGAPLTAPANQEPTLANARWVGFAPAVFTGSDSRPGAWIAGTFDREQRAGWITDTATGATARVTFIWREAGEGGRTATLSRAAAEALGLGQGDVANLAIYLPR